VTSAVWPAGRGTRIPRATRAWAPAAVAAATLAVIVWRVGGGPFRAGVGAVDAATLAAAAAIGVATTVSCAWRWRTVARGLGIDLGLPVAVAAYYRSLFLNVTLPGGIVGDVHRGVAHGRDSRNVARALRAVAWERAGGQAVQLVLTVCVLLALPSPVHAYMPFAAAILIAVVAVAVPTARIWRGAGGSPVARARRVAGADLRAILRARGAVAVIALTSTVVVAGHAATFLLAARAAGSTAPPSRMLPLALLAMLAMVLPSIAGWGPREGATGWAFAAAGLGTGQGIETAVAYGVMALVASLPGAAVLVWVSLPHEPSPRPGPEAGT
jgi:glycosyltransferase 2 family protein